MAGYVWPDASSVIPGRSVPDDLAADGDRGPQRDAQARHVVSADIDRQVGPLAIDDVGAPHGECDIVRRGRRRYNPEHH
jgi:hypothetical protein